MGKKIDKGKKTYTYAGTPKSYWKFAENRTPAGLHETPEMKARRLERQRALGRHFSEVKKRRLAERQEQKKLLDQHKNAF